MTELSTELLVLLLILLVIISAFFSGSETGMMALNRYRLRHLARKKHRAARRVVRLLARPDRLLGVILTGNTFANILASAIATVLAVRLWGNVGILVATLLLTIVILIFAEITPKTLAALYPQRVAFLSSLFLLGLLRLLYPVVWLLNGIANGFLRLFGVSLKPRSPEILSQDELRSVVREAGGTTASEYHDMLVSILDLEKVFVEHIMVPRHEIIGIDLADDWETILEQLTASQHTRLPVYDNSLDEVKGVLHLRLALNLLAQERLNKETLLEAAQDVYYVPENTSLYTQLLNFRDQKQRSGLVVDEYGDIKGLVTLEDILEEVVGEFTTDLAASSQDVHPQADGSYLVSGSVTLRELNRSMNWEFPTDGPKTLSGLIIEHLEMIPPAATGLRLAGYPLEIMQVKDNMIKTVRIFPALKETQQES